MRVPSRAFFSGDLSPIGDFEMLTPPILAIWKAQFGDEVDEVDEVAKFGDLKS